MRVRRIPAAVHATFGVHISIQHKHCYTFIDQVDDPVFGNTSLGVIIYFGNSIALRVIRADNLDYQIGPEPKRILVAWIALVSQQQNIRLTIFIRANSQP